MAERDRFELDLAAALRAYAEDAPMQVHPTELVRHFAAAYPHGTTTFGPWRFAAIPRLAWALLLGAALLAALVGGALLVGSQLQRRLPAVVPNLGTGGHVSARLEPRRAGAGQPGAAAPRPLGELFIRPPRRQGDRPCRLADRHRPPDVDVRRCTNTWTRMHPDREPPGEKAVSSTTLPLA